MSEVPTLFERGVAYAGAMDPEVISLCDAMNLVPGIRTIESCCGHGREPFRVWFLARDLDALPDLLYWFAGCHCGFYGWRVTVSTDCGRSPVIFRVEGPVGAFDEADRIAALIADESQRKAAHPEYHRDREGEVTDAE